MTPRLRKQRKAESVLRVLLVLVLFSKLSQPQTVHGGPLRTNEPVYQNPFDLASGGASLTRSTQEGAVFVNPSLPAFGAGFLRWIFGRTSFHLGADAVDFAANLARSKSAQSQSFNTKTLDKALKTPLHAGTDFSTGFITSNAGAVVFASARADLEGRQFGTQGLPELRTRSYGYGGLALSASKQFKDIISFGGAVKPIYNAEVNESLSLSDLQNPANAKLKMQNSLKRGYGTSVDAAVTLQKRSPLLDVRFAAVANDIGNTKFKGGLDPWKQTLNLGLGVVIHNKTQAVHCAVDVRDTLKAYKEHWTRRTYTGCKGLLTNTVGVGAGFYQGWPTAGFIVNLFVMRLEAGTYTKEIGKQAGTQGRRIYFVAMGFEIP